MHQIVWQWVRYLDAQNVCLVIIPAVKLNKMRFFLVRRSTIKLTHRYIMNVCRRVLQLLALELAGWNVDQTVQ